MKISFTNLISKKQWQSLIFVDMIRAYCIFIYEWWNNFVIGFFNRGWVFLNMTGDPWPVCRYIGYGGRHFNRARWDCFRSCRYLVKYFILTLFFASLTSKKSCRLCTHLHAQRPPSTRLFILLNLSNSTPPPGLGPPPPRVVERLRHRVRLGR